jgi:hypothetical protein
VETALGDEAQALKFRRGLTRMVEKRWLKAARAGVFTLATSTVVGAVSGCAVSESDVQRWETTERGPDKLMAVVTHDKYSKELRTEAAIALIRMKPRAGKRIGLDNLITALSSLDDPSLDKIVTGMVPELVKQITAAPPAKPDNGPAPTDPSIAYKDAAFAMLSHDPPLVKEEKNKTAIQNALITWGQTDFENRIENNSQAYGVEQMMRFLGAPSVKGLPALITEQSTKVDRISALIADLGDPDTKLKGSTALVTLGKLIASQAWIDKQKPLVVEANTKAGNNNVKPEALAKQLESFQDQELTKVFGAMKRLGGRPVIDYCLEFGGNGKNSEDRRKAALAALEGSIDKNNSGDVDKIFAIAKDDSTPDSIRDLAFSRLGELPKEQIVPKLYTLFEPKNWKIRWVAGSLVLRTMTTKGLPEFMKHLPTSSMTKMGMSEPINFGGLIQKMDAPKGEPSSKDAITPYLTSRELGPKLVALGYYYNGKKADVSAVQPFENDSTPVPKCAADDQCGWTCGVPKAPGSQETEDKEIKTVGEFVKLCVEPSMTQ